MPLLEAATAALVWQPPQALQPPVARMGARSSESPLSISPNRLASVVKDGRSWQCLLLRGTYPRNGCIGQILVKPRIRLVPVA